MKKVSSGCLKPLKGVNDFMEPFGFIKLPFLQCDSANLTHGSSNWLLLSFTHTNKHPQSRQVKKEAELYSSYKKIIAEKQTHTHTNHEY